MENSYLDIINKRKQIQITNIKKCNEYTSKYGLTLSDSQINSITENDIIDIQVQLLDERIYRYNGLDSSSIRIEIMEEISNSNIYTIGIYLKSLKKPDNALKNIKEKGIQFAYQEGKKQIDKRT
ncbi:MAG: DUF6179 domain-containing protein [Clostridia bacterium]|nr:DUF6179 domain-containing protein [Clostridia bacterium]